MTMKSTVIFLVFSIFRVLNVLLIQSQFDPDEYWQQLEPAYCRVFASSSGERCPGLTWEWKRRPKRTDFGTLEEFISVALQGPVRSYASIIPTLFFYHIIKYISVDSPWMVARGPVFLNAILVAASTDWCVWYLSGFLKPSSDGSLHSTCNWSVYGSMSSWFMAYALIRTYSNSLETVLLTVSLVLVAPELLGDASKVQIRTSILRACLAFFLGGLSCSIRFTSLAAFVPLGIILSVSGSRSLISATGYLLAVCAIPGLVGVAVTLVLDRHMYGFSAVPFLGNIQFNVVEGNGSLYGSHPYHWYFTAGIPAIAGTLTPFLIQSIYCIRTWSQGQRKLWFICSVYVVAHSFSAHKEFRFLLPILPLFCLLCGNHIQDYASLSRGKTKLLVVAGLANFAALLYLGLLHQRAPIDVNQYIVQLVKHEPQTYSVHYLMGCHSTPLLSHLHNPPVVINPWALDCSPSCRADPKVECESDRFLRDPAAFVEDTYFHCSDLEEGTCITDLRMFYPDFLVVSAGDVPAIKSRVITMGMREVGRFINGIKGLRAKNLIIFGSEAFASNKLSTKIFLNGYLAMNFDEIVLFANIQINPRF